MRNQALKERKNLKQQERESLNSGGVGYVP